MQVIDSHCHVWGRGFLPREFFHHAANTWASRNPERKPEMILSRLEEGVIDETGSDFIANMDRSGVDISFILMIDVGKPLFGVEPAIRVEQQIEFYAELQRQYQGRIYCHVAIDHRRPECLDLIKRALSEFELVGIGEITPDGFTVADEEFRPVMKLAAEHGVPVQIHTRAGIWTDFEGSDQSERNPAHPVHAARLAREIPDLKLVFCHAGFPHWWQKAAELIADLPNCVLDISNWNERLDEPSEIISRLATWRSIVGSKRILFASDQISGPRFTGERSHLRLWVDMIRNLPELASNAGYHFTESEARRILGQNARDFYSLD